MTLQTHPNEHELEQYHLDPEFKQLYLTALRSGRYLQTQGRLRDPMNGDRSVGYCCLGVAADVVRIMGDVSGFWEDTGHFVASYMFEDEEDYELAVEHYAHDGFVTTDEGSPYGLEGVLDGPLLLVMGWHPSDSEITLTGERWQRAREILKNECSEGLFRDIVCYYDSAGNNNAEIVMSTLTELNDHGVDFSTIARIVEEVL